MREIVTEQLFHERVFDVSLWDRGGKPGSSYDTDEDDAEQQKGSCQIIRYRRTSDASDCYFKQIEVS